MRWTTRLKKQIAGRNASALARSVGLPPAAIRNAARTGMMPTPRKRTLIAKALGVDAKWLFGVGADHQGDGPAQRQPPFTQTAAPSRDGDSDAALYAEFLDFREFLRIRRAAKKGSQA